MTPAQAVGDVNGDGRADWVFSDEGSGFPEAGLIGSVYVIYGLGAEAAFRRGDANYDDKIEITDAVFVLRYLFSGGEAPACEDAADADDTGELEITDAVFLLGHLFLGGPAPLPPHPEPGEDPSGDALSCKGY